MCIILFCLFDCLFGVFVPLENFSLIWRLHHYRWRAAIFNLCSALMAIEQWGLFNVPHLLRHGPIVYNGHLRGPGALTPVAERLTVELTLPVFTSVATGNRPPISRMRGKRSTSTPPRRLKTECSVISFCPSCLSCIAYVLWYVWFLVEQFTRGWSEQPFQNFNEQNDGVNFEPFFLIYYSYTIALKKNAPHWYTISQD